MKRLLLFLLLPLLAAANPLGQPSPLFERVFKTPRLLDSALVEQVKALEPGKRLEFDRDNDGNIDELWYLDTDKRHTIQPMLVRCLDEDGDMAKDGRGDLDSDLYFWDHQADGYIDSVVDYVDDDGDNDLDQQGIFFDKQWPDEKDDITVWWAVDVGDDNLLWYDVNGNYYQDLCQWRTHFSGDELFYQFRIAEEEPVWMNMYEDPFAFYNLDDDKLASELVIRITAVGYDIQNLRYSIDADDDADNQNIHNYDFSVTALPPEGGMSWKGAEEDVLEIRGIKTHPVLPWDKTKDFAQNAPWAKAMFIWDELNSNTDGNVDQDPNERWEGLLNQKSKFDDFPQVGGPPCGPVNKRMEISTKPASPLQLYFDEADQRFHLLGADYGYLDVDYNFDGTLDAAYTWKDTNGDGILDVRTADVDADGTDDIQLTLGENITKVPLEQKEIAPIYLKAIQESLDKDQGYLDAFTQTLGGTLPAPVQEVIDFYAGPLAQYHPEREIGKRIRNSPAGARYYTMLAQDRAVVHAQREGLELLEFGKGKELGHPLHLNGQLYTKRIKVEVERCSGTTQPMTRPESIGIDEIRNSMQAAGASQDPLAEDFNEQNCVVVDGDYSLAWRRVPHQIDEFEFGGGRQLTFLVDLPLSGKKKSYYIYYAPGVAAEEESPQLTNAVLDNPAYVAWESDAGAFRFYTGQFDFFGKNQDLLLPRAQRLIYPLIDVNYHAQQDWGIDALHVGKTSGLGGLTLYHNGHEYPVQSPAGDGHVQFEHEIMGAGPVRAGVRILAKNVFPEAPEKVVEIRCVIYAGHPETEVTVRLPEGYEDTLAAPGLMKFENAEMMDLEKGFLATWGRQGEEIGEIGLALKTWVQSYEYPSGGKTFFERLEELPGETRAAVRPLKETHRTRTGDGWHIKYHILGGWRRGMQYPVSANAQTWRQIVLDWEQQFRTSMCIITHPAEDLLGSSQGR